MSAQTRTRCQTLSFVPMPVYGKRLKRFARDDDGSMLIFGVYIFVIILMVGGIGIDLMRLERDRAELQYTMDRAVLAAADLDQPLAPADVVADYMSKAGLFHYVKDVQVQDASLSRTVTMRSDAEMITQFMHMTGTDQLAITALSAAQESATDSEVSLVIDISSGMASSSDFEKIKVATKDFISDLVENNSEDGVQTSVNIIPFAGQTNPGAEMFEYLGAVRFGETDSDYFPEWGQDISNITIWFDVDGNGVIEPDIDYSAKIEGYPDSDVPMFNKDDLDEYYQYAVDFIVRREPSLNADTAAVGATIKGGKVPTQFFSVESGESIEAPTDYTQPDLELTFNDFYSEVIPNDLASCIEMDTVDFQNSGLPTGKEQVGYFMNWTINPATMDWGWCPEDDSAIQYAQDDAATLGAFIDNLRLHDGNGTAYAMKYAVGVLDPGTQPAFAYLSAKGIIANEYADRPASWTSTETSKYIVVVSNGETTDQYRPVNKLDPYNATTELVLREESEHEIITVSSTQTNHFLTQCQIAKDNGVVIMTIAVDASGSTDDLLNCASSPAHFLKVTADELADAYASVDIAMHKLRLIQ